MEPAEPTSNNQFEEEVAVQKETPSEALQNELKAQLDVKEGVQINVIKEGKAKIYIKEYKKSEKDNATYEQEVFYNPVQIFNRDLTLLVIRTFAESRREKEKEKFQGIKILDALAASGLRTIRFMTELDPSLVSSFHTNDLEENAIKFIRKNFELNQLDQSKITLTHADANVLMYASKDSIMKNYPKPLKYDVIDLDPYGSAVPFLDTAVQAVSEGGLLCVTCTDMRVLGGSDYAKCFYLYGVSRPKMHCFQENALRIILYSISSIANKYCRYIKPWVSYQSEYYLRVFVTVHGGRAECQKSYLKYGHAYYCTNCTNCHIHQLGRLDGRNIVHNKLKFDFSNCNQCDSNLSLNGPIWIDPINDLDLVQVLHDKIQHPDFDLQLQSKKKIYGMLHGILQEKETGNIPLSVSIEKISQFMKVSVPGQHIFFKVINDHGYAVAPSYVHPNLWKTNAPMELIFDIIRVWRKESLTKENADIFRNLEPNSTPYICFAKPVKHEINLEGAHRIKTDRVPMFFPNPEKNWGPKKRAAAKKVEDGEGGDKEKGEDVLEEEKPEDENQQNGGENGDDDGPEEVIEKKVKLT